MDTKDFEMITYIAFGLAILIFVIRAGVKGGIQQAGQPGAPAPPPSLPADGPGKYRIDGVDRESKMDTTMYVEAASAANARAKAELEGVVVTAVTKV